jgi:hypothetical protein
MPSKQRTVLIKEQRRTTSEQLSAGTKDMSAPWVKCPQGRPSPHKITVPFRTVRPFLLSDKKLLNRQGLSQYGSQKAAAAASPAARFKGLRNSCAASQTPSFTTPSMSEQFNALNASTMVHTNISQIHRGA